MVGKRGTLVVSLTPCIARPRLLLCKILENSYLHKSQENLTLLKRS
jgi:hypothetical protein